MQPCLCGDPLCGRCFPQSDPEYGIAMQQSLADMLAYRVKCFLSYLEPDSLIDQESDPQLRQDRDHAEQLLRDTLALYRGD